MTDLTVHKVILSELENFFQQQSAHSSSVLPISPLRVLSYVNNPRALPTDPVLYYIEEKGKIIAFRTVWPDQLMNDGQMVRFAWCSGNWVAPWHRRKGLSLKILQHILPDWDHQLMFSNAAPESLAGYVKTALFKAHYRRTGLRCYLNASLKTLTASRKQSPIKRGAIVLLDALLAIRFRWKMRFFREYNLDAYEVQEQEHFSPDFSFVHQDSLFMRKAPEFSWIFQYPWIETGDQAKPFYPFSWRVEQFSYHFVSIRNNHEEASLLVLNREGMMKLLYWHTSNESMLEPMAQWLINACFRQKVKTLTLLDHQLSRRIRSMRNPFVASKRFTNDIYATFEVPFGDAAIFDGDGDAIFT